MRHFVIASVVNGSFLFASVASAQQQPGYGTGPAPAPTYTPAPMQPAPVAPAPAQPAPQPQYQPAPVQGSQPAPQPQPQYGQPAPQPQPPYGQPAPAPQQYAPQQQPQPQYAPQQQSTQPGVGQQQPNYAEMASPPPEAGGAWRPSNARFIIAGERMFGISLMHVNVQPAGSPDSFGGDTTMVNLLWGNASFEIPVAALGFSVSAINPYAMPMLSFHGVVGPGVTLGGGIAYASTSGSHEEPDGFGGMTKIDDPTRNAFAFAPRVGYLASITPSFGIWARAGITYHSQKRESQNCNLGTCITSTGTISGIGVNLDPMLVFSPVPHVGILLGPVIDIGVSGTFEREGGGTTTSDDLTLSNFGAAAGLALLF